ncbi:uncharacterized protein TM35_000031200 [Trypanosoma theileri]|uniref:Uncharacterized protein n=1 Tax=Trypanosoma theileri TaxID=67003 RepID=A0A1X0P605_9TRYP|nr:uncharacterized protein TM35_000031200 [Trypanosoma theileri]ORC92367.1 hypothetical protein TM35_000031200 [Trypanosoma theileri]
MRMAFGRFTSRNPRVALIIRQGQYCFHARSQIFVFQIPMATWFLMTFKGVHLPVLTERAVHYEKENRYCIIPTDRSMPSWLVEVLGQSKMQLQGSKKPAPVCTFATAG